jgi:hypothetical protein
MLLTSRLIPLLIPELLSGISLLGRKRSIIRAMAGNRLRVAGARWGY